MVDIIKKLPPDEAPATKPAPPRPMTPEKGVGNVKAPSPPPMQKSPYTKLGKAKPAINETEAQKASRKAAIKARREKR